MSDSRPRSSVYAGPRPDARSDADEPTSPPGPPPAIVTAAGKPAPSSPGTNSSRASSPTPTPARTTCTPCATSSPGATTPTGRSRSSGSPPATSATTSRPRAGDPDQEAPPGGACGSSSTCLVVRHVVVINPAATVQAERYSIVEGKTPEIGTEQARDAPEVDRRLGPGRPPGPGHPRRPDLHGRPRRRRRQADHEEPRARRDAVHPAVLREGRQVAGDPRPARPGAVPARLISRPPGSPRPPLPHRVPQDEEADRPRR